MAHSVTTSLLEVDLHDRFRGCLVGLAVGEALSAPVEFLTATQIKERIGDVTEMLGGGVYDLAPGEATDATAMMLCMAESLADKGSFAPEDIIERYRIWFEGAKHRVSLTVRTALISYKSGVHWELASRRAFEILGGITARNGSLSRCAPIGLRYAHDEHTRHVASQRESMLTHFDRLAGWCCTAFNDLVAVALIDQVHELLPAIADELDEEDRRVSTALRKAVVAEQYEIHSSAYVLDALQASVWTVLCTSNFKDAVTLAASLGNDASCIGAVSGALAGAMYGESAIPEHWLNALLERERAQAVADRLADQVIAELKQSSATPTAP